MSAQRKPYYTPDEYLALEHDAEYKSEYISGEIFAMAGASYEHNTLVTNVLINLGPQLRGGSCQPAGSDLRIQTGMSGPYFYPDAVIICGDPQFRSDGRRDTLLNPTVLIEVLSPSTEAYDRGEKFAHYRRIESLQEYLLVSQTQPRIERYTRQGNLWILEEFSGVSAVVPILSANCSLPLTEVYEDITFPAGAIQNPPGRSENI